MLVGISWALLAGLMLGLYALPGKYTKDFKFENTWGLFFLLTMFALPAIATLMLVQGLSDVFSQIDEWRLAVMIVASFLWGTGVMMWGKAIDHIGVSLGFSLFIGTVILIGSLLPFFVDGLPNRAAFGTIMAGIAVVLAGVVLNGKAGMARSKGETGGSESKSMATGIAIAVIGGLLATGFSLANAVGRPQIHEACQRLGNAEWVTAVAVMFPIFMSGGVVMTLYFAWQLTQKKEWGAFRSPHFGMNFVLILIMAFFHYAASAVFAYAAFKLGAYGNTVGYAIFNTTSVMIAVISGIVTKEWATASSAAKTRLYAGLTCMLAGIVIISAGNAIVPAANAQAPAAFPYGSPPEKKPNIPLSAAMNRVYDNYSARWPEANELFTNFKYTRLEGFDYSNNDGTVSRRDSTKVIRVKDKYYVWYTHRKTVSPPRGPNGGSDTVPSSDWDLAEIWYATSKDGFVWQEQGVAVPRLAKPYAGWRSVATPDILVWKGKYYLYYQAYLEMPGTRGDYCPVSASVSDSPDGPWIPSRKVVVDNGPPGSWDQYVIHDPYPLVYKGKIYLYYKGEMGGEPNVRAQGLAIADDPLGPFKKHPLNPVINSGHETCMFPFRGGIAALVSRHGLEHNTIQYAPDGVNFQIAATTALMPIAPGPYVPDAFTDSGNGRGITWGLCHFRNLGGQPGEGKNHSILARFDCDLSLDVNDPQMKQTDIFNHPEIYFQFGLSKKERERIQKADQLK
jgi:hypothetical protein